MAIYIETIDPQGLLDSIKESVKENVVQTWNYDEVGDFTHVSQWENKAWFKSYVDDKNNLLSFGLIGRKDESMTKSVYGIYHGRFTEMLLTHFDSRINRIELTPNGVAGLDSYK